MEPRNRFQGMNSASLCSLAGRYDNPIPNSVPSPHIMFKNSSSVLMSNLLRVWNQWDLRLSPLLELIKRDNNSEWKGRDRSYLYFHQLPDGLDIFVSSFSAWHVLMLSIKHFAFTQDFISSVIL